MLLELNLNFQIEPLGIHPVVHMHLHLLFAQKDFTSDNQDST